MRTSIQLATFLAFGIAGSSACKKEDKKEPAPKTESTTKPDVEASAEPAPTAFAPAAGESVLVLRESKITVSVADTDVDKVITITAEGKIMAGDEEVAALSASGEMSVKGEVVSNMSKDGTLTFKDTSKTMKISDSGEVTDQGKVMLLWNEDGTLGGEAMKQMAGISAKFEGAPESRRAASYAFLAGMLMMNETSLDPVAPKPAPAATP